MDFKNRSYNENGYAIETPDFADRVERHDKLKPATVLYEIGLKPCM